MVSFLLLNAFWERMFGLITCLITSSTRPRRRKCNVCLQHVSALSSLNLSESERQPVFAVTR